MGKYSCRLSLPEVGSKPVKQKGWQRLSALGRVGTVTEIAEVLAFCASDKASYLTGVDVLCGGGTVSSVPLKGLPLRARLRFDTRLNIGQIDSEKP